MQRMAWLGMAWLSSVACAGGFPGLGGGSSSSSGSAPLTVAEVYQTYVDKNCEYLERCEATRGKSFSTVDACKAQLRDLDGLVSALFGTTYTAVLNMDLTVSDQSRVQTCLNKLDTLACDDVRRVDPDCDDILVPTNPVAVGASCKAERFIDNPVCPQNAECLTKTDNADCDVCVARKADGASCTVGKECTSKFCGGSPGTCGPAAPKSKGQACSRDSECLGELQCVGSPTVCTEKGGPGAACNPTAGATNLPKCMDDLQCVKGASPNMGTCTKPLDDGASCSRLRNSVGCRHQCIFAAADSGTGTCGPLDTLPAPGQPCSRYRDQLPLTCQALDTVYSDVTFNATFDEIPSCTCKTKVAMGAMCIFNNGCTDGRCQGTNVLTHPYTPGMCVALSGNGQGCNANDDCASGRCTGTPKTCAAALSCP